MKITHIPSLAHSTSFLENRTLLYRDATNRLYPKMLHTQEMDFVYAR